MKISKTGYTLIEILVVMSIIGILFTMGMAAYSNFNRQRIIRKGADEIKTYLRLISSKAKNNEKDCSPGYCDCEGLDRPLIGWDLDLANLQIYGVCQGDGEPAETVFGEEDFLVGLSDLTITPSQVIRFYPSASGGGTDLTDPINITINGLMMLTVGEGGVVNDYEGDVNDNDSIPNEGEINNEAE